MIPRVLAFALALGVVASATVKADAYTRHHHHRYPVWGYQGAMNVLVRILDKIFDEIDKNTNVPAKTDYSFDIIR